VVVERTAEPVPARPTVIERRVPRPTEDVEPALVIEPGPEIVVDLDPETVAAVEEEHAAFEPEPGELELAPEPVEVPGVGAAAGNESGD
jgi:hypothetical protein